MASVEWIDLLVDISEEVARQVGIQYVAIRGSKRNYWAFCGKFSFEKAHERYDETAKRKNYLPDESYPDYYFKKVG